jgi:hypothetical protein
MILILILCIIVYTFVYNVRFYIVEGQYES